MEVSAGLEGPWQPLGSNGQNPAFQTSVPPPAQRSPGLWAGAAGYPDLVPRPVR